jgi:conjugal transfer pilus assembly protein TraW
MKNKILVLLIFCCFSHVVLGKDFGKQGTTFEIKEEGFVSMMKLRAKNIDLTKHEEKMKDLARKRVEEPEAVAGISRATKTISHSFDPTFVLDDDVVLPCGKLLYKKGASVNPLDHMGWNGKMVFIDGRDKSQINWVLDNYLKNVSAGVEDRDARGLNEQNKDGDVVGIAAKADDNRIVLIAGKPLELERETNSPIYFDQFGELTKKFNITHVPAVVEQDGKYLKVTEINIGGR